MSTSCFPAAMEAFLPLQCLLHGFLLIMHLPDVRWNMEQELLKAGQEIWLFFPETSPKLPNLIVTGAKIRAGEPGSFHVITGLVFLLTYTRSSKEGLPCIDLRGCTGRAFNTEVWGVDHDWEWRLRSSGWPEWGKSSQNHPIKLTQHCQCQALGKKIMSQAPPKSRGLK